MWNAFRSPFEKIYRKKLGLPRDDQRSYGDYHPLLNMFRDAMVKQFDLTDESPVLKLTDLKQKYKFFLSKLPLVECKDFFIHLLP
jgi:hypothetical protein